MALEVVCSRACAVQVPRFAASTIVFVGVKDEAP
jgi:hypothetical protein